MNIPRLFTILDWQILFDASRSWAVKILRRMEWEGIVEQLEDGRYKFKGEKK